MNRRDFLSRAGLLLGGGIIAGPDVLDAFGKLTWRRKYWSGAMFAGPYTATQILRDRERAVASLRQCLLYGYIDAGIASEKLAFAHLRRL